MSFVKLINTKINTKINSFMNNIIRCSHHYNYQDENHYKNILKKKIIINLLGENKFVDIASWEIKSFAQEKQFQTANIVYDNKMINHFLIRKTILQFIVNRCYNMSCQNLLYLNNDIINTNKEWIPYNLYVIPNVTNRFVTCDFIRNCHHSKCIIYPLAASEENKRRDISLLLE